MHTVWKYELQVVDEQIVEMPRGAKVLYVDMQHDKLCIWMQVNDAQPQVKREFAVHGTGHYIKEHATKYDEHILPTHVGSFMMYGGELVFHVFDHGEVS